MTDKKPVVVSAVVHEKSQHLFHFVFEGDVADRVAMKEAAWHMLNTEKMLAPLECVDREFVDDESDGTAIEVNVELGNPDDFRTKPKQRTKKQLWRRVARLAGEVIMRGDPAHCTYGPSMNVLSGASAVRELIRTVHEYEAQGLATTGKKLLSRLEAALKDWEAAQ